MYVKQLNGYTVAQLKEELAARNLETVGKKAELLVRLAAYLEEHVDDELVEALALGELPKKGTPVKKQELDTSEVVEEEKEADVTNGTADTGADAKDDEKAEAEGAKMGSEDEKDEEEKPEEEDDANVSMESAQEETGETKANGDTSAEAESSEQTMEEAMDESSELKVLDEVGPDDDDDTKKEEEKKKKKKRKMLSWPRLDELLQEKRLALKLRTIVIGPVEVTDLDNEIIRQIVAEAESFHYKTTTVKTTETTKGIINACLKDKEACESFVEKLSGFKDNVRVEQCGFNMSQEKFFREITKEDEEKTKPERMEYRTAIIRNLPEEPNVETLKELFPDAPNISIVIDQEGKCKGWAYVEFTTSKDGQEFIDAYKMKKEEERPKMDDEVLRVGTLQHIGKLYIETKKKEDKGKEKSKERPEGLLSDEERIRKPQLIRMWKQRLQNLEPLKKTRPEYYERQKKTLEENIKKAEKAVEEDDAKRKEHGIPIPEPKKEAEKKKEEKKDRSREVRPMKRKAVPGRSEYRPVRERRDHGRRDTRGLGSMTREEWQKNRSSWSGGSGAAATANAVNLIVGLSKIFGNQQMGGSQYDALTGGSSGGATMGGYSGGSGLWNGSGSSSIWGSGGSSGGTYRGGYSSLSGPSSKRPRPQVTSRRSAPGGRFGGKRQEQLDQMRKGKR